jgi:hypothetical protein
MGPGASLFIFNVAAPLNVWMNARWTFRRREEEELLKRDSLLASTPVVHADGLVLCSLWMNHGSIYDPYIVM